MSKGKEFPPRLPNGGTPPTKIYFMGADLQEFEGRCDLGDFRTIQGALYPHKDHAQDCIVYLSSAEHSHLLAEARSQARAEAFEEAAGDVAHAIIIDAMHSLPIRFRNKAKAAEGASDE